VDWVGSIGRWCYTSCVEFPRHIRRSCTSSFDGEPHHRVVYADDCHALSWVFGQPLDTHVLHEVCIIFILSLWPIAGLTDRVRDPTAFTESPVINSVLDVFLSDSWWDYLTAYMGRGPNIQSLRTYLTDEEIAALYKAQDPAAKLFKTFYHPLSDLSRTFFCEQSISLRIPRSRMYWKSIRRAAPQKVLDDLSREVARVVISCVHLCFETKGNADAYVTGSLSISRR
jgi:hypothetical protein